MFVCPHSIERREKDFIVCKLMLGDRTASDIKAAASAMCAHQRYCTCKNRAINSDGAEACYNAQKEKQFGKETRI